MEEEERWFGRRGGDKGADVDGGGGGGGDRVGGEVGVGRAVDGHFCGTGGGVGVEVMRV